MTSIETCSFPDFVGQPVPRANDPSSLQLFIQQLENYLRRLKAVVCTDLGNASGGILPIIAAIEAEIAAIEVQIAFILANCCTDTAPGGNDGNVQYNNGGVFGGEDAFAYDDSINQVRPGDSQLIADQAANPSSPSAGGVVVFGRKTAISRPWWVNSDGKLEMIQPSHVSRTIWRFYSSPLQSNAAAATVNWENGYTFAGTGTLTFVSRATTNAKTRQAGLFRNSSGTGNSALAEWHGTLGFVCRGDAASVGGFYFYIRFGAGATPTNLKMFFGLAVGTSAPTGTTEPSAFISVIGIGCDSAQTTLRIIHNDGAGAATVVDLGANFPSRATDTLFDLHLYAPPNGGTIEYYVVNVGSGNTASGQISTNLPTASSYMVPHVWMSNGATAGAVACVMDIARAYMECYE